MLRNLNLRLQLFRFATRDCRRQWNEFPHSGYFEWPQQPFFRGSESFDDDLSQARRAHALEQIIRLRTFIAEKHMTAEVERCFCVKLPLLVRDDHAFWRMG